MQSEQIFGELDQGYVVDDARRQDTARTSANNDSDQALMYGLNDDKRWPPTTLTS